VIRVIEFIGMCLGRREGKGRDFCGGERSFGSHRQRGEEERFLRGESVESLDRYSDLSIY
jgi:hypothetical protein